MKQLQLRDGDLVLGQGGFATVEGAARVAQDLGCAIREEVGTDRFHPAWGTVLNDFIGRPDNIDTADAVKAEVARVISNYTVIQTDTITKDADAGRKSRFKSGEVIAAPPKVQSQQTADRINVRATVTTISGETVMVMRSVGGQ